MHTVVVAGWIVWGMAASSALGRSIGESVARRKERDRIISSDIHVLSLSDLRVLINSDSRDPIERHTDALIGFNRIATLSVAGITLLFVSLRM